MGDVGEGDKFGIFPEDLHRGHCVWEGDPAANIISKVFRLFGLCLYVPVDGYKPADLLQDRSVALSRVCVQEHVFMVVKASMKG